MPSDSPLGRPTAYPNQYSPALLRPIARAETRSALGLGSRVPFHGVDIWNAWELSWLGDNGCPRVATAEIRIPADSANMVESKSLKLYLNSFSMSRFESADRVADLIGRDIGNCVGRTVRADLAAVGLTDARPISPFPGRRIDDRDVDCDAWDVDANLLSADGSEAVSEVLHSHLLRSLCPVTAQPDTGSVVIDYTGPKIDSGGLLRYIVSYRNHNDFHEACVERMFVDILERCAPDKLSVYARFLRRGGIDINPYRSTEPVEPRNERLWRQ